ncbi:MAG: saccharopine dehydrogenase NADP-binding domain-containing protein [Pseudomonadota bacterium]
MKDLLIYGAYGYSGRLILAAALARGLRPIAAGRDADKLAKLAREFGVPQRAFSLDDPDAAQAGLEGIGVVLHCAGPFSRTAQQMANACIARRAHYLDITGEWAVIEALAQRSDEFARAGIMAMPAVGFDVVPSDCLAAHMRRRLPTATHLELHIRGLEKLSRGTANSFIEALGKPGHARVNGELRKQPAGRERSRLTLDGRHFNMVCLPWGDIASAWRTTGIGNIKVHMNQPRAVPFLLALAARAPSFWQRRAVQAALKRLTRLLPPGPDAQCRAARTTDFIAVARDAEGRSVATRLSTPEAYALTAQTATEIARRVMDGEVLPGFATPGQCFGPDFILGFEGAKRTDL